MGETFNKLKECKTIKELCSCLPMSFFTKMAMIILVLLTFSPFVFYLVNPFDSIHSYDISAFYLLVVGYLGVILVLLKLIHYFVLVDKDTLKQDFKINSFCLTLAGLLIWIWICALTSESMELAIFGDIYRREGALRITSYFGLFGSAMILRKDNKLFKYVIWSFLLNSFIMAVFLIFQSFGCPLKVICENGSNTFSKYVGVFENANHYGYYLCMSLCALAILITKAKKSKELGFYSLGFLLTIYVLSINNTFGAYLALLVVLVFIIIMEIIKNKKLDLKSLIPLGITLFVGLILEFVQNDTNTILSNFSVLFKDVESVAGGSIDSGHAGTGRWQLWCATIDAFVHNPIFGVGPDGLTSYLFPVSRNDRPHNEFLQYLAFYGVLGLILYIVSLFLICFKNLINFKTLNDYNYLAFMVIVGYLISSLFGNTMYYTTPYFFMFLGLSVYNKKIAEESAIIE